MFRAIERFCVEQVAAYVGFLRMFFLYGLSSSQGQTSETRPWKEASAYRPPHLRGKIKSLASTSSGSTGMVNESSSRESLFDSDQSDSDGSVSDNDRYKSSRCRITAISTIQVFFFLFSSSRLLPLSLYMAL